MNESSDSLLLIVAGIFVVVILFVVLREVFLWYYKINEIVRNQQTTNRLLRKMLNHQPTGKVYGDINGEIIVENTLTGRIKGMTQESYDSLPAKQKKFLVLLKK